MVKIRYFKDDLCSWNQGKYSLPQKTDFLSKGKYFFTAGDKEIVTNWGYIRYLNDKTYVRDIRMNIRYLSKNIRYLKRNIFYLKDNMSYLKNNKKS